MRNKKQIKALLLLLLIMMLMGVLIGCVKEDVIPSSSNDSQEDMVLDEETGNFENTTPEILVETIEEDLREEENQEELNYIVGEDGKIQPMVQYASGGEFYDFVNSLELEEAVLAVYGDERNCIIYNGDSFMLCEYEVLYLITPKELSSDYVNGFNTSGISIWPNIDETLQNLYGLVYYDESISDYSLQLEYADGSNEELAFNITAGDLYDYLELTELALLHIGNNDSSIIFNGDEFAMTDSHIGANVDGTDFAKFRLRANNEIYDFNFSGAEVDLYSYDEYEINFWINPYIEQDLVISVVYADGTEEDFSVHFIPTEEILGFQAMNEWIDTFVLDEVIICIWNDIKKEGYILENNQEYIIERGDELLIYGNDIVSSSYPAYFESGAFDLDYSTLEFTDAFVEPTQVDIFVETINGEEYQFYYTFVYESEG